MNQLNYTKQPDGTWKKETVEVTEESLAGNPLFESTKALAEANPGKVAFGAQLNDEPPIVNILENL